MIQAYDPPNNKKDITPNDLAMQGHRVADVLMSYRKSLPSRIREAVLFRLNEKK